jgi:DNA integrity scanning protein DisA with diadenylate cyclase activity
LSSALVTTDGLLVVSNKKIKIAQDYLPMANLSEH